MPSTTPAHFTRDPSLSADAANAFGGGAGNAEALIEANNLRYSQELIAAQMLPGDPERTADFDHATVASTADLDDSALLAYEVHGAYLVYVFEGPDGRTGKDVLLIEDGGLEAPERADSPQRAQLRAAVAAKAAINEAQTEAERVLADAREEAARIVAQAAAEAEEQRSKTVQEAADQAASDADKPAEDSPSPEAAAADKPQTTPRPAQKGAK